MIALALTALCALPAPQNSVFIEHTVENGDIYCDIQARDFPIKNMMERLCSELDLELTGFEDIEDSPRVTVYLRNRPLNVAIEYALGAAGLSGTVGADRIDVTVQTLPFPSREHSLQSAEISFLSSLQRFPDGSLALDSREQLAQIALMREETEKAARYFELLSESNTNTAKTRSAHMSAAALYVKLQDWSRAIPHYQLVGNIELDETTPAEEVGVIALARRELARCILMRGESRRAYYMLEGLGQVVKPLDDRDAAERLALEARAKIGMGDYEGALLCLDRAQRIPGQQLNEFETMDLRAKALEANGHPVEAAVAWLHFSRDKSDDVKRDALVRAAKSALKVEGEELGVIFLHHQAQEDGLGEALMPYLNEARTRLGLDAESYTDGSISQRLRRGVQLATTGLGEEAIRIFTALKPQFHKLPVTERIEFGTTYGPLLENEQGVSYAIDLIREVTLTLDAVENRSKLYLVAGEIYERNQMFNEAAAAYGGQL